MRSTAAKPFALTLFAITSTGDVESVMLTGDEAMFTPRGEATEKLPVTLIGDAIVTLTGLEAILTALGLAEVKFPVTFTGLDEAAMATLSV